MEEGSFRCDANVSIRKPGNDFGTRAEIKNINSFKFVESAINYEVSRQAEILESGGTVDQETRLYDPKNETRPMRSKEEANDYRYFPDPDLLPVEISSERINQIKSSLPELPDAKKSRYMSEYDLKNDDAEILSLNIPLSNYFEDSIKGLEKGFQVVANFILTEVTGLCNKHNNLIDCPIKPEQISKLMQYIDNGKISSKQAKDILNELWSSEYALMKLLKIRTSNKFLMKLNSERFL